MIDEKTTFQALTKIIKSKDIANLIRTLIIELDKGEYLMYGIYCIKKVNNIYEVYIGTEVKNTFSTLRAAVTWATLDSRNNIMSAKRVDALDKAISGADFNIELHKKLHKKTKDIDMKIVQLNKLQDETLKRKKLAQELDSFVTRTHEWQLEQFKNQTSK